MKTYTLSDQAIAAIMMAVQKGMFAAALGKSKDECDIVGLIKGFELEDSTSGLVVNNPPIFSLEND